METGPLGPNKPLEQYVKPIKETIKKYIRLIFGKKKKTDNQEDDPQNTPSFPGNTGNSGREKNNGNKFPKNNEEMPVQDQDSYIPKDMEFGETEGEQSRFAVVYPFLRGKYATGKLSYFSPSTNLWSKKRQLQPLNHSLEEGKKRFTYAGFIVPGVNAIPLPTGALPDTASLIVKGKSFPVFSVDQNGCVYISSSEKMWISFEFGLNEIENTKSPIEEDNETMIFSSLSKETKLLLEKLQLEGITIKSAKEIEHYIKTQKKYSTKVQGTLRNKSNHRNYVKNLDESEILECYSANTLFVALCRYLGLSARLVTGFAVDSKSKKGEGLLSSNNGHARSEVWDETQGKWIEFDATPIKKEDGEDSNQNRGENNQDKEENNENSENQEQGGGNSESSNSSENSNSEPSDSSSDNNSEDNTSQQQTTQESTKSPSELLDELLDLAKKEDFEKNKEKLEETKKKIQEAKSKEEVRDILDNADLGEFSQEEANEEGNQKILDEEKKELEKIDSEKELDKALENTLLDDEFKNKLEEYVDELRRKIQEQKKRMQKEMERLGFTEEELGYYKEYKELEKEVEPEVKRQIKELEKILPANYQYKDDETQRYRSGYDLDGTKLVDYYATGDTNIFIREDEVREHNEINMFETIIIDTSGSMGNFGSTGSILRESVKAAIIRAKVLEHFKVDFSIVLFGDTIKEVMSFGEKFSSKGRCLIPSKLMRAVYSGGGGNSQEPISYVYDTMLKMMKKKKGKSFGNISFIGDGDLYQFQEVPLLKAKIDDLRKRGFGVTAYYINDRGTPLLGYYFGEKEGEDVVYARGCKELSKSIIESHRKHLQGKIRKFMK